MVTPLRQRFTFAEYLALEAQGRIEHEFLDGLVRARAGGSPDHGAIAGNIIFLLSSHLRGRPCRVFTPDVRIRVRATGLGTYPDVSVVCDRQEVDPDDPSGRTIINPKVIVEASTEDYDRGEKLAHDEQIPSLEEVVLVAHEEQRLEVWRRTGDHWTLEVTTSGGATLTSLGCTLDLAAVYANPLEV